MIVDLGTIIVIDRETRSPVGQVEVTIDLGPHSLG